MADVRVRRVEFESPGAVGVPVPVVVAVNNLETVALAYEEKVCHSGGEYGHRTDVTLAVRDSTGSEVWSETTRECIPKNRVGQMMGANARIEFRPEIDTAGEYTVEATVSVMNESRTHSGTPRTLTISDSSADLESGDDPGNGGSNPFVGGGDNAQDDADEGDTTTPLPDADAAPAWLPNGDIVVALIALALIAWLVNSGADITEAVA